MRDNYQDYQARNIQVLAVYAQGFGAVRDFARREQYPFPILVDEGREVTKRFGVYVRINLESWNMARPATIGVDADGLVRLIYVGRSQFDWPKNELVLAALGRDERGAVDAQAGRSPSN